jgi:hypothetical protein
MTHFPDKTKVFADVLEHKFKINQERPCLHHEKVHLDFDFDFEFDFKFFHFMLSKMHPNT